MQAGEQQVTTTPYNPLEKIHLAESIVRAILGSEVRPLSETSHLVGAGVYVIYYAGKLPMYTQVSKRNVNGDFNQPLYIGKAIPKGGRKGSFSDDAAAKGTALRDRLGQHLTSVTEGKGLRPEDFYFRSLMVDDIWIPLGENMLIEHFKPVWNLVIDGFGNKDPGKRRKDQYASPWDVIHPGRKFTTKLGENPIPASDFIVALRTFFADGKVVKPKKPPTTKGTPQTDSDELPSE